MGVEEESNEAEWSLGFVITLHDKKQNLNSLKINHLY